MKKTNKTVIDIFREIASIPHCSAETGEMRRYLVRFAESCGYEVAVDAIGNVAAYREGSVVTLQSHYDMVCIGRAPDIRIVEEEGWMRAEESSLGADNGMGVAITLWLMRQGAPVDALFTNDEEIGLIGAGALEVAIRTPRLLNLDSEELGKVYIGCAGGEDIHASKRTEAAPSLDEGAWYRLLSTAPGGHSGVNIAERIPNAITRLCGYIYGNEGMEVAYLKGGERINAIPRRAEALVRVPAAARLQTVEGIAVEAAEALGAPVAGGREIVGALFGFAHGVRGWNRDLDLPQSSVNLALVELDERVCKVSLSARAMDNDDLDRLVRQCAAGWEACGFECRREGWYPAWKPETTPFAQKVLEAYRRVVSDASFAAIHAGLECALFADRYPDLQIASIGPTILDPHSDRERVDMASVYKVLEMIEELLRDLSSI